MKKELILIAFLIIIAVFLVSVSNFYKKNIEIADAKKFVMDDLASKYPGASMSILSVTNRTNTAGDTYFEIKAKATKGDSTPCPERVHIYYNYPAQNFVTQTPDYVTLNCKVCSGVENKKCVIAFSEEAIIASHTLSGTSEVEAYIKSYKDVLPLTSEDESGWLVVWDSPFASYSYTVSVSRSGSIIGIAKKEKNSNLEKDTLKNTTKNTTGD